MYEAVTFKFVASRRRASGDGDALCALSFNSAEKLFVNKVIRGPG